jgi:hypothetical protein
VARYSSPGLLTPPREEEEVYPYRRVWPSIILEIGALFGLGFALFVAVALFGMSVPPSLQLPFNLGLTLLPVALWLLFSYLRERTVPQPRRNLLGVFIISALVANAISIPLMSYLRVEQWLSLAGTIDRVLGYTLTIGILHELPKYIILRYGVWSSRLRTRLDMLAYGAASAVGYATVLNIHMALESPAAPDIVASRVIGNLIIQLSAVSIVAYGLAELRFNPRSLVLLPAALMLAAFIHGVAIPVRAGLISVALPLGAASTRPLFGLIFALALSIAVLSATAFLFNTAERQEREAFASGEV